MNRVQMLAACSVLALGGLGVAGCGSSDNGSSSSSSGGGGGAYGGGGYSKSSGTTTKAAAPAAAGGGGTAVVMQNIAFNPPTIHAKVGQVVTWTNKDSVDHTVKAVKGEEFKSNGNIAPGAKYAYKVDKAGTITYMCTIHPNMQGTIIVTK